MKVRATYRVAKIIGKELDPGLVVEMLRRTDAVASGEESDDGTLYVITARGIRELARLASIFGGFRMLVVLNEEASTELVIRTSVLRDAIAASKRVWDAQFAGRPSVRVESPLAVSIALRLSVWYVRTRNRVVRTVENLSKIIRRRT